MNKKSVTSKHLKHQRKFIVKTDAADIDDFNFFIDNQTLQGENTRSKQMYTHDISQLVGE